MVFIYTQPEVLPPHGKSKEWLLTNGIGGFAASTISGINTRRYHGYLVASMKPPVERRMLLAKVEEEIIVDGRKYPLLASETLGGFSGLGFKHLALFQRYPFPLYLYQIEDILLEKEIIMVKGQNTALVRYQVYNLNERTFKIRVFPLITNRDYHWTLRRNDWPFAMSFSDNSVNIEAYPGAPSLYIYWDRAIPLQPGFWYYNVYYEEEAFRGLDAIEDLYCPFYLEVEGKNSVSFWFAASTEHLNFSSQWAEEVREQERKRLKSLPFLPESAELWVQVLTSATQDFLVEKRDKTLTVIAGYPWFTDWGRDALISLPGLTLVTGRYEDFRQVMTSFLAHAKGGIVPNLFSDLGGEACYNTADASLWVFWAIYKYFQYTKDLTFIEENISQLQEIIENYSRGTMFGIKMDEDGLITQGEEEKALTWMDAVVDGKPVTPRWGKAVEINALWHFALKLMSFLSRTLGQRKLAQELFSWSELAKKSFQEKFWNDQGGYLFDVVRGEHKDDAIRCNQIIAVSLPTCVLTRGQERLVLETVWRHLYTPLGLRTLSPFHPNYRGRYRGNQGERDRAYHQGTVWVWPWGHFMTAIGRLYRENPCLPQVVWRMVQPFLAHLADKGLGTVSEIFDGDAPHSPQGCFAQAWSVAEVLRVVYEIVEERVWPADLECELFE